MKEGNLKMKTSYEEIVDVQAIGAPQNTRSLNEILAKANQEKLQPASKNVEQILVIGIDIQNDFLEQGALAVQGSCADTARFTQFIYDNMDKIAQIAVSIDTHNPFQIFHPCWWVDTNGINPTPFTPITLKDLDDGKWFPVVDPIRSRRYVEGLESKGKKNLLIWPYHCLQGTHGAALENQFANMVYFHSVAKKTMVNRIVKGTDCFSEMYGLFAPEFDEKGFINLDVLNKIAKFDKIVIAGQASDFCVYESIKQLLEFHKNNSDLLKKVFILEDCMSSVMDAPEQKKIRYDELKKIYKVNIVKSTDLVL